MAKHIYGIDFGTTNSTLVILDADSNRIVKLFTTPSLLFFPDFQGDKTSPMLCSVGEEAVAGYVGNGMKGRFMKSIKRVLPNKSFVDTKISNKSYTAEDLVSLILVYLKKQADAFLGEEIKTAVIGRPVVFDEDPKNDKLAQDRLSKAAKIAGFETVFFQMEPIGAAFTYERQIQKEEIVLVADFGGGTSDFSIMKLSPYAINRPDRKEDMIAKGGIYIGGDSFDSDIMWHKGTPHFGRGVKEQTYPGKWLELPSSYFLNICAWDKMNFLDTLRWRVSIDKSYFLSGNDARIKNLQTLIGNNLGYKLFKQIEKCKFGLTSHESADFSFEEMGIEINETIGIEEFESEIIKDNIEKIENYLKKFLESQNINPQAIDTVFMTGGTSYIKALQGMFETFFGRDKIKSGDNFNSVAMGLAYSYNILEHGAKKDAVS